MELKNDLSQKYHRGTIGIHWLTTVLILILFPMGLYMSDLAPSEKVGLMKLHIILGLLVFLLTLVRSYLFFKKRRPPHLQTGSKWNDRLARWVHNLFYVLLILVSFSGIATMILGGYIDALKTGNMDFILDEVPPLKTHKIIAFLIMFLFVAHVLGVIKHYFLTKENTIRRIF